MNAPNPTQAPNTPGQPNHSLDRRRDEKVAEQMATEHAQRITDITATSLEVWQKQLDIAAQMAKFWSDAFQTNQQAFTQFVGQIQSQTRRSA